MQTIEFKTIENKIYADKQLASVFLVTDRFASMRTMEIQPLTITRFVTAVAKNFIRLNYYRWLRGLYLLGMLDIQPGEVATIKKLRLPIGVVNMARRKKRGCK
jgi:hypothetical protein